MNAIRSPGRQRPPVDQLGRTGVDLFGRTEVGQLGRTQCSNTGIFKWTSLAELRLDLIPRTVTTQFPIAN